MRLWAWKVSSINRLKSLANSAAAHSVFGCGMATAQQAPSGKTAVDKGVPDRQPEQDTGKHPIALTKR